MKVGSQKCFRVAQVCWNASRIRGRRKKKKQEKKRWAVGGEVDVCPPTYWPTSTKMPPTVPHVYLKTFPVWSSEHGSHFWPLFLSFSLSICLSAVSSLSPNLPHTNTHTINLSQVIHIVVPNVSRFTCLRLMDNNKGRRVFFPHAASWLWTAGLDLWLADLNLPSWHSLFMMLSVGWHSKSLFLSNCYKKKFELFFSVVKIYSFSTCRRRCSSNVVCS